MRLNDYVMAIACMKDKDRAENTACIYGPVNGKDGFDVSLVLCKRPFQVISIKKRGSIFFLEFKLFARYKLVVLSVSPRGLQVPA